MTASALYDGAVIHRRFHPRRHRLRYRLFQMLLDLDEAPRLARRLRLFSLNRFNLFSFFERDHGDGRADLKAYVREVLLTAGIEAGGPVRLLCMPRILGYVFNPLSVYYCHRADGRLAAVLYEVNNTFGDRHSYLIPAAADGAGVVRQACEKRLYVSPFMDMAMSYDFRLTQPDAAIATTIHGKDAGGRLMIAAAFAGKRRPLDDATLAHIFVTHPLLTLKVVAAIHWEALRLFLKGVGFRSRPEAPAAPISLHASASAPQGDELERQGHATLPNAFTPAHPPSGEG